MQTFQTALVGLLFWLAKVQGRPFLTGSKVQLDLYKSDRTTLIGSVVNDMVIDLAKTPQVNNKASVKSRLWRWRISSLSFYLDNALVRTDNSASSWLLGDPGNAWTPTIGVHMIGTKAYGRKDAKGRKVLETTVQVMVIDSNKTAPTVAVAPVKAPVVAAPVPAPVTISAPATGPMVAPMAPMNSPVHAAPAMTAPVVVPVPMAPATSPFAPASKAPIKLPTRQPTNRPTKSPTRRPTKTPTRWPTMAPTRKPSRAPTAMPTPCSSDIVQYINKITLSSRTLTVSGFTALDEALIQLISSNSKAGVLLSTCIEADRERLRQRFAYLALVYSTGMGNQTSWFDDANECAWDGITCNGNSSVTEVLRNGHSMTGSIPADVGLWSCLSSFDVYLNKLTGSLPWTIGLWTALTKFDVGNNKLNGTLPPSIGSWTGLTYTDMYQNKFTGSLPNSIGAWTNITYFDVNNNQLTGSLPASIGNWTSLIEIGADYNMFTGAVPAGVANWASIDRAYFEGNQFNGTMPTFLSKFCPKNRTGSRLSTDCSEIVCTCCSVCK
jgi:hypothetical protein